MATENNVDFEKVRNLLLANTDMDLLANGKEDIFKEMCFYRCYIMLLSDDILFQRISKLQ